MSTENKQGETITIQNTRQDGDQIQIIASVEVYLSPEALKQWEGQLDLNEIIFHASHLINHEQTKFPVLPPGGGKV